MTSIILLFHGSRYPTAKIEAENLARRMQAEHRNLHISAAFLQQSEPSLPEALAQALSHQCVSICVLPLFALTGRHMEYDVPKIVEDFKERHPEIPVTLDVHLGADDGFARWLSDRIGLFGAPHEPHDRVKGSA